MNVARHMPLWIAVLLTFNVALVLAPIVDFLLGSPYRVLSNWLHLDSEASLPAWYSSMQWLCAAVLFGLVPTLLWRQQPAGGWLLAALALVCLAFSIDEIVGIHEWVGRQSDALLPGGDRANTGFTRTGIWPFLVGVPVLIVLAALGSALWRTLGRTHTVACVRMIAGFSIMFTGALVVELGKNFIDVEQDGSGLALLQLAVEEFLELLGGTVVVWSAYEFARDHGLALQMVSPPKRVRF